MGDVRLLWGGETRAVGGVISNSSPLRLFMVSYTAIDAPKAHTHTPHTGHSHTHTYANRQTQTYTHTEMKSNHIPSLYRI